MRQYDQDEEGWRPARPAARWGEDAFTRYRGCVAFIASEWPGGTPGIGTCFHVGEGAFITARHVIKSRTITEVGFGDGMTALSLVEDPKHWRKERHGCVTIMRGPLYHDNPKVDLAWMGLTR